MRMEDTKEVGTDELQVLKRMVLAWKEDYTGSVPADGGGEYLCQDFSQEIEENLYPYVRRMVETDHISQDQAREFLAFCYRQVMELRDLIEEPKSPI
jgi:hypothetical protein